MSAAWLTIAALAVTTALIRASGPLIMGARRMHPRLGGVVDLLAPALLSALILVQTLGAEGTIEIEESLAGVAAAGLVLWHRRDALPAAIIVAAVVTAGLRLLI